MNKTYIISSVYLVAFIALAIAGIMPVFVAVPMTYFCIVDMAKRSTAKKSENRLTEIRDKKNEFGAESYKPHAHDKYY